MASEKTRTAAGLLGRGSHKTLPLSCGFSADASGSAPGRLRKERPGQQSRRDVGPLPSGGRGGTDVFHPPRSHVQPRSTSCPRGPRGDLRAPGRPAPPSQATGTPSPPHSSERPHLLSIFFILISQGMKMTMKLQARRANFRQSCKGESRVRELHSGPRGNDPGMLGPEWGTGSHTHCLMPLITPLQDSGQYEGQSSLLVSSVQEAPGSGSELCCLYEALTLQGRTCLIPPVPALGMKTSTQTYLRNNVQRPPFDPAPGVGSRNPRDQQTAPGITVPCLGDKESRTVAE